MDWENDNHVPLWCEDVEHTKNEVLLYFTSHAGNADTKRKCRDIDIPIMGILIFGSHQRIVNPAMKIE